MVRIQACLRNSAFPLALAVFKTSELSIPCPTRGMTAFQKARSSGQTKIMCNLLEFCTEKLPLTSCSLVAVLLLRKIVVLSTLLKQGRLNDSPSKRCLCHLELIARFACKANALRDLIVPAAQEESVPPQPFLYWPS